MTQQELQKEYDQFKDQFDNIKEEIEKDISRIENYKGVFYEIFPFSYQRGGFKQGKLIENMNRIKSTNEMFVYGFNKNDNIIEIKEGISIENEFYYQFLFYDIKYIKSLNFDNNKDLQNIRFYCLNKNDKVDIMYSKGKRGGREEKYEYNKMKQLERIVIKQFDRKGNEGATLIHSFTYDSGSNLKSIVKSAIGNNDYSEIIYPPK